MAQAILRLPNFPLIMGIINITPDSFYAPSRVEGTADALLRARALAEAGAAIIDIGGESTRPGAAPVSPEEECARVVPVIGTLAAEFDLPISIDTRHALVAEQALAAGASIINDISGLGDPAMRRLAAESGAVAVLMHMQGEPADMQQSPHYQDAAREVESFFIERIRLALEAGMQRGRIWLDPGIGFGKRLKDNLALIRALPDFARLGYPLLVGFSRKSFIREALALGDEARGERTVGAPDAALSDQDALLATCLYNFAALERGAAVIRVHDAREAALTMQVWRSLSMPRAQK
ncbi:MAG: dihydropteroate synthase [Spirochaetota bacterium]|nr:dihydropteroate synthase [Spirochaetota bacterium]